MAGVDPGLALGASEAIGLADRVAADVETGAGTESEGPALGEGPRQPATPTASSQVPATSLRREPGRGPT